MNTFLQAILAQLGYNYERTEVVQVDNLRHRARYNAIAVKTKDGQVFVAQALGYNAEDAEHKLVNMLARK